MKRYCHSADGEWYEGDYSSEGAAVEAYFAEHPDDEWCYVGRAVPLNYADLAEIDAEEHVADIVDRVYDATGCEDFVFEDSAVADLQERLNVAARTWLREYAAQHHIPYAVVGVVKVGQPRRLA